MKDDYSRKAFDEQGFAIVNNVFSRDEIQTIITTIENISIGNSSFQKSKDLFAIRRFLIELPGIAKFLFTDNVIKIIQRLFGPNYFIVKSIYFDKPPASNWFVSWHQDLTIAVDKKMELDGFSNWTTKQDSFAVQPPLSLLENNFTLRIHLDNTDASNGALKVIPASHTKGIVRPETISEKDKEETICEVERGGIMLMRPLLLHSSNRTINNIRRRVIHIEFSNRTLPPPLQWAEYQKIAYSV